MFYKLIDNEIKKVDIKELDNSIDSVGYLTMQELEQNMDSLGINKNIIHDCMQEQTDFRTSIDTYSIFSFGFINIINVMNVNEEKDRIAFIIKKHQFIVIKLIDNNESSRRMFADTVERFQQNASLEKIIFGFLERLLVNGNKSIESTEKKIIKMEQDLVNGNINRNFNREIFKLRKDLSLIKNYYEQLVDIGEELQENENNLFAETDLNYFRIFTIKADRLRNNTQELYESLIHLRETLDASLNYSLNKIMKVFTVITTIFLPLTLIVGWYGMNFTYMPELNWKYGYLFVVIICIVVVTGCIAFFKKKKLF
jgi:magnesium transporter